MENKYWTNNQYPPDIYAWNCIMYYVLSNWSVRLHVLMFFFFNVFFYILFCAFYVQAHVRVTFSEYFEVFYRC